MGIGRLRGTTILGRRRGEKADSCWAALAAIALLAAGLSACGTESASLPSTLPSVSGGIIRILTAQLADGIVGRPYNNAVETTGAFEPITSCAVTGTLPPGLTVSPSGPNCAITGTPAATGTFNFTLTISDSSLIPQSATLDYTITVRPEFTITAFQVVDAVAGRTYNNSFQVTTNLQNNPVSSEVGSNEPGNGPGEPTCNIQGLPANMDFTCDLDASGVAYNVSLFSTGPIAAGGPLNLTLSVTDQDILQNDSNGNPQTVVQAATLDNNTTAAPFAVTFTVRPEFQVVSPVPLDTTDAVTGRSYTRTFAFTTDLANNGDDVPNDVNPGESGNGPLDPTCAVLGLPMDFNGNAICTVDPGGLTGTVQITSASVGTAPSTLALTLELTDADIPQGGVTVVPPNTQNFPFSLTVRGEYSITSTNLPAPDTMPTAVQNQPYDFTLTVTTDTVAGANDVGQAAELGNGSIATCDVTGLPTGLAPVLPPTTTANSCSIQITGSPTTAGPVSGVTVTITDMPIPDTAVDVVPAATLTVQPLIDILVATPLTFSLRTDPIGGTFDDAASGPVGVAPDAGLNRTYGNGGTGLRDLLFEATGGIPPYTWAVTGVAPTPIGCTQEGASGEFFRCNSGNPAAPVTGATSALVVEVTDSGSGGAGAQTVSVDDQTHPNHTINVRAALGLTPNPAVDPPPTGVRLRTYGDDTGASTCPGAVPCVPPTYAAGGGLLPYVFTTPVSEAAPSGNGVPAAVACTAGATVVTCTSGASTVTAAANTYPFTVTVDDTANDTTPADSVSVMRSIDIVPELTFEAGHGTSFGNFTVDEPLLEGAQDRIYAGFTDPGVTTTNQALIFRPDQTTGLGIYSWGTEVFTPSAPGDLACFNFPTTPSATTIFACCAAGTTNCGVQAETPQLTAGTFNIEVTLQDQGNAAVPQGAVTADDQGHTSHDIIINDRLAVTANDATSDAPPVAVVGREYGNMNNLNCTSGACVPLTYSKTGGLPGAVTFAPDPLSIGAPGAGVPAVVTCTNDGVSLFTCTSGASVITATPGGYDFTLAVDDTGNALTVGSASSGTTGMIDRTITVNPALGLAVNPDPPETAVNLRRYGGGMGCSLGNCVPVTWTASGGTGDPALFGSYVFTENGIDILDPVNPGFPNGITCTTQAAPNADDHVCSATVAVDVNVTGPFTVDVTVDDQGNETTPTGSANVPAAPRTLTVNPELRFDVGTGVSFGTFVGVEPIPEGVVGRIFAGTPSAMALLFRPDQTTGLGTYIWDAAVFSPSPPGDLQCFNFPNAAGSTTMLACCANGDATNACGFNPETPQPTAGAFDVAVTLRDVANQSTPAGFGTEDNLTHTSHPIVINPALSISSPSTLDSVADGDTPTTTLMSVGGLQPQAWTVPGAIGGPPDPLNAADTECAGLTLATDGSLGGTAPTPTTDFLCNFTTRVDDTANALTIAGFDSSALVLPVASAGSPVISNDVLINGLEGFDYIQTFEATGTTPFVWTGPGAQCPAIVGATVPGAFPTGTSTTFTTTADVGTLTVSPATVADTFNFGVCVEGAGAAFAMKNFTVVINDAQAFTANSSLANVSPIDTATNTVGTSIAVGATPFEVAITPDGTRAYVTTRDSDSVSVIDTTTNTVSATIGPLGNPIGIAITPDGTLAYFADNSGDSVGIIDTDPASGTFNTVLTTVDLSASGSSGPLRVAITPDGSKVYVTNTSRDVSVIETAGNTVAATVDLSPALPAGVAVAPSGDFTYVALSSGTGVSVIETTGDTETTRITVGSNPERVAFTPDGTLAYVTNFGSSTVSVIDTSTQAVTATIALASTVNPLGVDVTPDGASTYVTGNTTNDFTVIDVATDMEIGGAPFALPGGANPDGIAIVPYPVLHFTVSSLPDAADNTAYTAWVGAMGGTGTLNWIVVEDAGNDALCSDYVSTFPNTTGIVSGSPNFPGGSLPAVCSYDFTVTDSHPTVQQSITQTLTITVN